MNYIAAIAPGANNARIAGQSQGIAPTRNAALIAM